MFEGYVKGALELRTDQKSDFPKISIPMCNLYFFVKNNPLYKG
ncbi:MAG: hypothetical protein R8K22_05095 [Mariprofundaceae bacterium]